MFLWLFSIHYPCFLYLFLGSRLLILIFAFHHLITSFFPKTSGYHLKIALILQNDLLFDSINPLWFILFHQVPIFALPPTLLILHFPHLIANSSLANFRTFQTTLFNFLGIIQLTKINSIFLIAIDNFHYSIVSLLE